MKTYEGERTLRGVKVTVDGAPLPPRTDLHCFNKTGFEWTYAGPGPRQLAFALLADHLGDDPKVLALSEAFRLVNSARRSSPLPRSLQSFNTI